MYHCCSFISGISLLGTPTEIYIYGTQYMYIIGAIITMGLVMMHVYLPVFHDLKLVSTYEVRYFSINKQSKLTYLFILGLSIYSLDLIEK